ncbi:MAG: hypothetical protein MSH20_08280 [Lachnospiraceae bacterium]|nr:hypothetical protein [Lachnospiraceae bacterium]
MYQDGNFYIENRGADTGLKKLGKMMDFGEFNISGRGPIQEYRFTTTYNATNDGPVLVYSLQTRWTEGTYGDWEIYVNDTIVHSYSVSVNSYAVKTFAVSKGDIIKIVWNSGDGAIIPVLLILYP